MNGATEKRVAYLLKSEIDKQDINQKEMARDIHISPQLLSHQVHGRRAFKVDGLVDAVDYLQKFELALNVSAELFGLPKVIHSIIRDEHPLTKLVNQNKEERDREEIEEQGHIWELVSIMPDKLNQEQAKEIQKWLKEYIDEISAELGAISSVCDKYGFDIKKIINQSEMERSKC